MNQSTPEHLAGGRPADAGDLILERRFRLVARWLPDQPEHLVDFGCGNGAQTRFFAGSFATVTGLDVNGDFIDQFDESSPDNSSGITYDGWDVPLDSASADFVTSFEVLEHVADEDQALREVYRILRPGGMLAMTVPNRWWIFETHGAALPLLPWNRVPFFSWLPKGLHDRWAHARIYRRREIVRLLRRHEFDVRHSAYVTAPMDVVKFAPVRDLLRATVFRGDTTLLPFLSTAVLVIAQKPVD